jgi:hypothetical protein
VEHGERKTRFHQPRVVLLGHNRDEECFLLWGSPTPPNSVFP